MHNVDCPENSLHSSHRLQRGHAFEEQFEFIRNPACRTRNNCKRIWSTSAKEPCVTQSCFNHLCSQPANRVQLAFPLIVLMSRRSLLGQKRRFDLLTATLGYVELRTSSNQSGQAR